MTRAIKSLRARQKIVASLIGIAGIFWVSEFVNAHHSNAMFDKTKILEVTATVREFQWTNPHIWIEITIKNDAGEQEDWSIEGIGPNTLFRKGWRPNSFKPGDVVEFKFSPMLDGSTAALFVGARFANGDTLGNW